MRYLYLTICFFLIACNQTTDTLSTQEISSIESKIKEVMDKQSVDWSNGDIDGFMEGYWKDDKLRFVGSKGITYGWDQTKANYKRGYPDKSAMGKLEFETKDIDVLSKEAAILLGSYTLYRTQDTLSGNFTLTWKQIDNKWLIVSDMTCGS